MTDAPQHTVFEDPPPLLEAWYVMFREDARMLRCLAGLVTGHPLLPGRRRSIQTSPLEHLDLHARIARTRSRAYRLGPALSRYQAASATNPGAFSIEGRAIAQRQVCGCWLLTAHDFEVACFPELSKLEAIEALLDIAPWRARN